MYWKDYYHRIFQKLSKSSWKKFSNFCLHNFLETNSRRYFMDFFFFQMDKEYLEEKERGSRCRQALVDKSAAKKRIPWRGPNIYLRKKAKGVAHLATSSGFHFHFAGLDHAVWNNARVGRSKKRNARPLFCKRGRRPPFKRTNEANRTTYFGWPGISRWRRFGADIAARISRAPPRSTIFRADGRSTWAPGRR